MFAGGGKMGRGGLSKVSGDRPAFVELLLQAACSNRMFIDSLKLSSHLPLIALPLYLPILFASSALLLFLFCPCPSWQGEQLHFTQPSRLQTMQESSSSKTGALSEETNGP